MNPSRCLAGSVPHPMRRFVRLGLLLVFCPLLDARAASFDCTKAETRVERLVCGDADLSRRDDAMNRVYRLVHALSPRSATIRQEQRRWLQRRDACADAACLHESYAGRIAALERQERSLTLSDDGCAKAESLLLGGWGDGDGFFEEMDFSREDGRRLFSSWLHQRPELAGAPWRLDGCTLSINHPGDGLSFTFRLLSVDRRTLLLQDLEEGGGLIQYQRLEP